MLLTTLAHLRRVEAVDRVISNLRVDFPDDVLVAEIIVMVQSHLHRFAEAIEAARHGLTLDATHGPLHQAAFYAYSMLGRFQEAEHHSGESVRLQPDSAQAHYNFGLARLRSGDFEQGWKHFGWYEELACRATPPDFPPWRGEPLAGRTILLMGEQGLGDQMQLLSVACWMNQQGATVDVRVGTPLWEVARDAAGVHAAWNTTPPQSYDYWCRMFSAPRFMPLRMSMLPLKMPYLFARAERIEHWREKMDALDPVAASKSRPRRIGILWAGSPGNQTDAYRSIPLREWEPLLRKIHVTWFGLQKDIARSDSFPPPEELTMHFLGPDIGDFSDSLAILHELDLVISVDTSIVHLAGAAGLPAWVLVPACTDWRWMTDRSDTPWYPSVRIFRQKELGCWDGVFRDVEAALEAFLQPTH